MRLALLAPPAALLALAALAAGCGDDPPDAPPPPPPLSPSAPPAAAARDDAPPLDWTGVRVGDTATWEVRVEGTPLVTTLTWTATAVEGGQVSYDVESTTTGAAGRPLATARSAERRDALRPAVAGDVVSEGVEAAGVPGVARATRRTLRLDGQETTVWLSGRVPFGGLARARGPGGVTQSLVRFSRGPGG